MKKKRGFTLVELLVVMAIIAILASIVVPNVAGYLRTAQSTRALAEIQGIELALTKMLSDAGRTSLGNLFNPDGVRFAVEQAAGFTYNEHDGPSGTMSRKHYEKALVLYTRTLYALLREGRGALNINIGNEQPLPAVGQDPPGGISYRGVLEQTAIRKLGTIYLDIGQDPWGELYNIFPGPWRASNGPNIFRKYLNDPEPEDALPGSSGVVADALTVNDDQTELNSGLFQDPETGDNFAYSFPAPRDRIAYIWSNGENLVSGQGLYLPAETAQAAAARYKSIEVQSHYEQQSPELIGGGDDVNNWDPSRTWSRFYS